MTPGEASRFVGEYFEGDSAIVQLKIVHGI